MLNGKWFHMVAGGICMLLCASVHAQQMYRCGKAFQDTPCDGNQQINSAPAAAGNSNTGRSPSGALNVACTRRGEDAQKIVWAKEAGRTEEQQLAAASNSEQRRLIVEVYRRRGTSGDIRNATEGECVAEQEKAAQAAALLRAMQGGSPVAAPAPAAPSGPSEADKAAEKRDALAVAERNKMSRCKSTMTELANVREQQRAGTSREGMDRLNQRQAETERTRRELGC
ncbi:MAG: hypothetical protein JWN94_1788 [Betaproteobacteria bacterium]|nr:hypothetical protein [Betaproteobacteria bacterium]